MCLNPAAANHNLSQIERRLICVTWETMVSDVLWEALVNFVVSLRFRNLWFQH